MGKRWYCGKGDECHPDYAASSPLYYLLTDVTQKRPHPKSLSQPSVAFGSRARDLPEELSFALREKAARLSRVGDEGFA